MLMAHYPESGPFRTSVRLTTRASLANVAERYRMALFCAGLIGTRLEKERVVTFPRGYLLVLSADGWEEFG